MSLDWRPLDCCLVQHLDKAWVIPTKSFCHRCEGEHDCSHRGVKRNKSQRLLSLFTRGPGFFWKETKSCWSGTEFLLRSSDCRICHVPDLEVIKRRVWFELQFVVEEGATGLCQQLLCSPHGGRNICTSLGARTARRNKLNSSLKSE